VTSANEPIASERYIVPALERGLKLLTLFDRQRTEISAPEAARMLGLPRSTTFRLIRTLEHFGLLERAGNAFRLGPGMLRLGFEYVAALPFTDIAKPIVESLRDATGYAAQLAIQDGREVVFIVRAVAASAFASSVTVGTRMPAHATALGRVFLAELSGPDLRALYRDEKQRDEKQRDVKLQVYSPQTPRTFAELVRLLRDDHARGYATSESFFEAGISAIAAPVRDGSGRVVAALSVTIPKPTLPVRTTREEILRHLLAAAANLSHHLNYRPAAAA
jgi:DNA-binding IclR family transcriptional regulator